MLHHISTVQALNLWSRLSEAFTNTHSYGGEVAEIYLYTVMARSPMLEANSNYSGSMFAKDIRNDFRNARAAILTLFRLFEQQHDCRIEIERDTEDFVELGEWFVDTDYEHRIHVRVTPSERQIERLRMGVERRGE